MDWFRLKVHGRNATYSVANPPSSTCLLCDEFRAKHLLGEFLGMFRAVVCVEIVFVWATGSEEHTY